MKKASSLFLALLFVFAARAQTPSNSLSISFVFPTDGEVVNAPLYLRVNTSDSNATVVSVQYFAGTNSIGIVSNSPVVYPLGGSDLTVRDPATPLPVPIFYSPFMLYWNPSPGNYTLTAEATDSEGNTAISTAVNVTVIPTPIVTVEATQPSASPGDPGIFTINSTGDTNAALQVDFNLGGTAQNGIDYAAISNSVTIPAGQTSAQVVITPLVSSSAGRQKTVILSLMGFPIPLYARSSHSESDVFIPFDPPYQIGSPSQAVVFIQSTNRNLRAPTVRITRPRNGRFFAFGSSIPITAQTFDSDAYVTEVEFFDGTNQIGITQSSGTPPPAAGVPFEFIWTNAPIGRHVLTALATDSENESRLSAPVRIVVLPAP